LRLRLTVRISKARKLFGESRRLTSLQLCVSFIFETSTLSAKSLDLSTVVPKHQDGARN